MNLVNLPMDGSKVWQIMTGEKKDKLGNNILAEDEKKVSPKTILKNYLTENLKNLGLGLNTSKQYLK